MYKILSILILPLFLTGCAFNQKIDTQNKNDNANYQINIEENDNLNNNPTSDYPNNNDKIIDIENTAVLCKDRNEYLGKDLINNGFNFKLIGGLIFYKGEELEKLCNPDMGEYDYGAEPSFIIIPAYLENTE